MHAGVEFIGYKIGDSRLGSMETGTSLTRAMIAAVHHGCDVVNLSYGEGSTVPNSGRCIKLIEGNFFGVHHVVYDRAIA
jgi:tripeptidyl-peptidase II